MEPLSREFLATCREDDGRLLRGEGMTRIETFVDADPPDKVAVSG